MKKGMRKIELLESTGLVCKEIIQILYYFLIGCLVMYRTIVIVTVHFTFGRHAEGLGTPSNDYCTYCWSEKHDEIVL